MINKFITLKEKHFSWKKVRVYFTAYFCSSYLASIIFLLVGSVARGEFRLDSGFAIGWGLLSLLLLPVLAFISAFFASIIASPLIFLGLIIYLFIKDYRPINWVIWTAGSLLLVNIAIFSFFTSDPDDLLGAFLLVNLYMMTMIAFLWFFHNRIIGKVPGKLDHA